jgi:hypothetical protein
MGKISKCTITTLLINFFMFTICEGMPGIKLIHSYRKVKKEIDSAICVVDVNFSRVVDDQNTQPSHWKQIPSPEFNTTASKRIEDFVSIYSRRSHISDFKNVKFNIVQRGMISEMFYQLDTTKHIDQITVKDEVIELFSTFTNRYVLMISQNGYHFSQEYIEKLEEENARDLASLALFGAALAMGGVFLTFGHGEKGYSEIQMAYIDKQVKKVLYYAKKSSTENPQADSTIIYQLQPMFFKF